MLRVTSSRLLGGGERERARRQERFDATAWQEIQAHDLERRKRLVRILSLGIMIPVLVLIPSSLYPKFILGSLVALLIVLVGTLAAFLLNRWNKVLIAGYALVTGVALALAWQVVSKVLLQRGVDALDLRYYDLLVLPILLSAVLLGRRGPVIIACSLALFSLVSLLALPRTPTLQAYWTAEYPFSLGSAYDVVALAVLFQLLAGVIGWLGSDSIRRALLQALRADELAHANQRVQAQAAEIEAQRQRLQEGMAAIQQVHAAIGRGNWNARVRMDYGELLPMAVSLNLLLDRLTRLMSEQGQRTQLEATAHDLALAMRQARNGAPYALPDYTGTMMDEVLLEFAAMRPLFPTAQSAQTNLSAGQPDRPALWWEGPPSQSQWSQPEEQEPRKPWQASPSEWPPLE